jgi:hypothetical protein
VGGESARVVESQRLSEVSAGGQAEESEPPSDLAEEGGGLVGVDGLPGALAVPAGLGEGLRDGAVGRLVVEAVARP